MGPQKPELDEPSRESTLREVGQWEMCAYTLNDSAPRIIPAALKRDWMEQTIGKFATRCLPMMIANQAGWTILNSHTVRVIWNGGPKAEDLSIEYWDEVPTHLPVVSYFGEAIITWRIPLLFRTAVEVDLWVRGPANTPKRHVYPLEGIVETNWAVSTFTMNWQILVPDTPVVFAIDEPICQLVPFRTRELELFRPTTKRLSDDPDLASNYRAWESERTGFILRRRSGQYQLDYLRGRAANEHEVTDHRTRLNLLPFEDGSSAEHG